MPRTLLAMKLGVTDLHWLARIYSLGLFGVPTALYCVALVRACRDTSVLAATLVAIAVIFMTSSFFIIGEYNTGYACAVLAAVWLGTASGLRAWDGFVLALIAALAAKCYQHYIYLGPLLGLMTLWAMARAAARPWFAMLLHGIAAVLFFAGGLIAANSLAAMSRIDEDWLYILSVIADALNFRFNVQLDLLLTATAGLAVWGIVRPDDLRRPWPYLSAGMLVLLLAASPALVFIKALVVAPYSYPQTSTRTAVGPLTALFVVVIWLYASGRMARLRALSVLKEPRAARHLVVLASAMVVATMPWNIMLTSVYKRYLEVVRTTIRAQSGPIAIEDTIFEWHPRLVHQDIAPDALSVIMRTSSTDGVMTRKPPGVVDPEAPPDLGRFRWRD